MPKCGVATKAEAVLPALVKILVQRLNERPLGVRIKVLYCAEVGSSKVHTIQLVEEFNRRGVHFRALDLGIDSRTPAGKMIIGVFSSFNQYEHEKSLVGILRWSS